MDPSDGSEHCSDARRQEHLNVCKGTVQRILHKADLESHRLEHFGRKSGDIVGLYLNPLEHAAAFCVDEKLAIQAH